MGDLQWVRGEIRIDPPLSWNEIRATQDIDLYYELKLDIEESSKETPEGTLIQKSCRAILPFKEEKYKGYHIGKVLQAIVGKHPGHTFIGHFDCWSEYPEEPPRRIWIENRIVYEEKATIVWPNEK